jgi:lactoylglutathione lyase
MKFKKALFLLLGVLTSATAISPVFAQNAPTADHIALYVKDLNKSAAFYKDVMQLEVIPEPFHDGKHVWFRTGEHSQLHIIQGAAAVYDHDINTHIAYHVNDLKTFTDHLDKLNVKYGNWKGDSKSPQLRPDGVKQVYLQDPDNFWIEVNDDKF